jgi:hypothetical protein
VNFDPSSISYCLISTLSSICFQPDVFWGAEAKSTLQWIKDFDTVMDCDMKEGKFEWFKNGQLNAAGFCNETYICSVLGLAALI